MILQGRKYSCPARHNLLSTNVLALTQSKKHSIAQLSANSRQHLQLVSNHRIPMFRGHMLAMYPALHPQTPSLTKLPMEWGVSVVVYLLLLVPRPKHLPVTITGDFFVVATSSSNRRWRPLS